MQPLQVSCTERAARACQGSPELTTAALQLKDAQQVRGVNLQEHEETAGSKEAQPHY